ncbi:unnamed protein product [Didymodactylos carnosus]|uniref:Helitron helicase-like domain-containing protein n=1 Tax=Didymodactylos carnosus TaxID=1234261 RepID=A0A815BBV5_9BILA|nr:unnamed protein product [Didymodactylos carnosus]CAF1267956.1 unnamed protein product [Didymodactylos carnosus]CAF3848954.1 unnamed protein product [Didymodactylos carnosus]CAF4053096.1 unnamed protein product [Didymodactylos carnosus]
MFQCRVRTFESAFAREKQFPGKDRITVGQLRNDESLRHLMRNDTVFRHLQHVRGSPQYWQHAMKDLFGYIRQLSMHTFFVTLSCADMFWKDYLDALARRSTIGVKDIYIHTEKENLIQHNPVLATRLFDHRLRAFLRMFIFDGTTLDDVQDFFVRVEAQMKGSKNAPRYRGTETDEKTRQESCDSNFKGNCFHIELQTI